MTKPCRVLIVGLHHDDAHHFRRQLAAVPARFRVDEAPALADALAVLDAGFDAVIIRVHAERPGDLEAVRRIAELFPSLAVLGIEGEDREAIAIAAIRAGAQDCLALGAEPRAQVRAITLAVERRKAHWEGLQAALDRFHVGVALINESGRVFLTNRAAEEILAEGDGLSLQEGALRTGSADERAALQQLVASAAEADCLGPTASHAVSITRPSQKRSLCLVATPLRPRDTAGRRRGSVALFISDPDRESAGSEEVLGRLYGFSPAEARLAWLLMQGKQLQDCAQQLGVSIHTVRTQLRSVLEKTNTNRQSELVRLLANSPGPMRSVMELVTVAVVTSGLTS